METAYDGERHKALHFEQATELKDQHIANLEGALGGLAARSKSRPRELPPWRRRSKTWKATMRICATSCARCARTAVPRPATYWRWRSGGCQAGRRNRAPAAERDEVVGRCGSVCGRLLGDRRATPRRRPPRVKAKLDQGFAACCHV